MFWKPICWIGLLFCSITALGQASLQVQGNSPSLFLIHKVQPKETWFSMGRLYNLAPKEIGAFNGKEISSSLSIGQQIKIPLTDLNFEQSGNKTSDEVLVPLYHSVKEGEWMFRVSTNHNKVPIEQLEKWNNISRNQVKAGLNLIVGYLKVKKDQSSLASGNAATIALVKEPVKETRAVSSSPNTTINQPAATGNPVTATTPVKTEPATSQPINSNPPVGNSIPATKSPSNASIDFKGGYFKSQFGSSAKSLKGLANIFRSTSGWADGKYYALMDNVPVGTIVMITNTVSNKYVYAKVLGNLSDIRENAGLTIRISNAAAAELGTGETKFSADVKY